jgi:hypothetical protein
MHIRISHAHSHHLSEVKDPKLPNSGDQCSDFSKGFIANRRITSQEVLHTGHTPTIGLLILHVTKTWPEFRNSK